MTIPEAIAIAAAGVGAGTINTVVGSGTLLTFPVLLGFGYAPVVANVSNTVGLVAGGVSGTHADRAELAGQRRRAVTFGAASTLGGITGAALLLALPGSAFKTIVPFFIGCALVLVVVGPWLASRLEARRTALGGHAARWTLPALFGVGLYGGYFGAAQGILLLAVLGLSLSEVLQRVNALKNVLATSTNAVAALVFVFFAHIDWRIAALLAVGSLGGGRIGARLARHLPPSALRAAIVAVGIAAIVKLAV